MGSENISSLAKTVRSLNLSHNELNGEFFKSEVIGLFRNLEVLDLGYNQLSGELPSLGSLPNLRVLRLGGNQLFGSIPGQLLESSVPLEELDLCDNGFTDELMEMLKVNMVPKDYGDWLPSWTEWKVLYNLCKNKSGLLQEAKIKAVCDGTLFEQMRRKDHSLKRMRNLTSI